MNVQLIKPEELRGWWGQIRPGLEQIQRKTPEEWIPEDVYSDCFNGRAMIFALMDDKTVAGYFVLQPMGIYLHVWAAWGLSNNEEIVFEGLKCIKEIARQGKARFLTFSSHRKGWFKRAAELGFKPRQYICEV